MATIHTIPTEAALWQRLREAYFVWRDEPTPEAYGAGMEAHARWAAVFLAEPKSTGAAR